MVSSNGIKSIAPDARNCFYDYEMDLVFYEKYTFINCQLECAISEVEKNLSCIPWHLPKVNNSFIETVKPDVVIRRTTQKRVTLGQPKNLRIKWHWSKAKAQSSVPIAFLTATTLPTQLQPHLQSSGVK